MRTLTYKKLTDEEVIDMILLQGKDELFEELYKRYAYKVRNKCLDLLHSNETAKDFTNDIFLKAFEKLKGFKREASFSSWLFSITYNYCIDYLRMHKKLHYPDWNGSNDLPEIIDEVEEDHVIEDYEMIMTILDRIHPEEKTLLLMKYHDNIPISQIACALRISESATKMRLKRARARVMYLFSESKTESSLKSKYF